MKEYLLFALNRFVLLVAVSFFGISGAFFISHLTPISPVESIIGQILGQSTVSPEAVAEMRRALTELFGLDVPLWQQYISFWGRLVTGDLGPSLMGFPVPAIDLVMLALPWTVGLLTVSTIITWIIGNILGGLAGYFQNSRLLKLFGILAIGVQPVPYYIVAFLLIIVFGFLWPILPISGGFAMNVRPGWTWQFALSIVHYSLLPSLSLVLVGLGTWFLGMRALVSNIVTEDYVTYAELASVPRGRIVGSYVIRNALIPQLTALSMALGGIFSGTIITEQVFTYPGLGSLLVQAVNAGDTTTVLAVSSISIVAVAGAIFIVDLLHPILDPRVRAA